MAALPQNDTIIALSSGSGRSGVSVFRLSGPNTLVFLDRYLKTPVTEARVSSLRWLYDEKNNRVDQALILKFDKPNSFTGEDLVEIHCHGSIAVQAKIIELALSLDGFRLAEPGEFSKRAFENEKMDLIQAEGLADLLDATTETQRAQAVRFGAGDSSAKITEWKSTLLKVSALLAASIDFSDEGDVGEDVIAPVFDELVQLEQAFDSAILSASSASRIRDGIRIAILGKPNAGKSSFINYLSRRDVSIVSETEGTTRDIVETPVEIAKHLVTLADTAGLRETKDDVEAEGVRRARQWSQNADIRIYLQDVTDNAPPEVSYDILVGTKIDLQNSYASSALKFDALISSKNGQGWADLLTLLERRVLDLASSSESAVIVRERHILHLKSARSSITSAKHILQMNNDVDLASFELSQARKSLERILGRIDVEDILGEVFSGFCVGK